MKSVRDVDLKNKPVFLRVDFNVSLKNGGIADDYRIKAAIPTIKYLLENKAKIIIGTHLGRPEGHFNPAFSTVPVAEHLAKLLKHKVYATDHVISGNIATKIKELKSSEILMLGNLRFHSEEEVNNQAFARDLAGYAEIYVNDAFGVSHRANASVEAITNFLPSYAGLLLESEVTTLSLLLKEPVQPFVLVIGGAKIKDKAGLLLYLADKADKILVGGAVATTFLLAKGENVSQSLCDRDMIDKCEDIMLKFGVKIILPDDTVKEAASDGSFRVLDIGPKTVERYVDELKLASTIFWNGNMGYTEDERYASGTMGIAKAIVDNKNTKVAAGGDTVTFINQNNLQDGFSFISTGGSASMQFLAGEKLPGIEALNKSTI